MTFKSPLWYPIAVGLSVINLVGVGFAAGTAEPWHATMHAALGLGFGFWAQRLRQRLGGSHLQSRLEPLEALEALEAEVSKLGQELSETQERLDFTERLLAQGSETRRGGPERHGPMHPQS
ncbi:MAG: hypothetical protein M3Q93_12380 [Gemmatimonadota bacterium]|nr:hypothetical protein [Gemmatimonadota bacterium]